MAEEPDERTQQFVAAVVAGRDDRVAAQVPGLAAGQVEVPETRHKRRIVTAEDLEKWDPTLGAQGTFQEAMSRRAGRQTVVAAVDAVTDRFPELSGDHAG
jgi:hypothetical protein